MSPLPRFAALLVAVGVVAGAAVASPPFDRVEVVRSLDGCDPAEAECSWIRLVYPGFPVDAGADNGWNVEALRARVDELLLEPVVGEAPGLSAEDLAERFLRSVRESSPVGGAGWWIERSVEVAWSGERAMTLRRDESSWTGGAHPNHQQIWLVVDTEGAPMELARVVNPAKSTELLAFAERAFRAYQGLPPDEPLDALGFWFEAGRFELADNWGITAEGLVFHYNPYEVAAYALGHTEFVLEWAQLHTLLAPGAPVPAAAVEGDARDSGAAR